MKPACRHTWLVLALALNGCRGDSTGAPELSLQITSSGSVGVTKIAPDHASAPHPFTLIDTPSGRLVDGSVVVLTSTDHGSTAILLKTHAPYNTAQGDLPSGLIGGDYTVSVTRPDGSAFPVGTLHIDGPTAASLEPHIDPTSGWIGSTFTITDPQGRMQQGDIVIFYRNGSPGGVLAANVSVSADGTRITGDVPGDAASGPNWVAVRPPGDASRFNDLPFDVF